MTDTTWRYCVARDQVDGTDAFSIREVFMHADTGKLSWSAEPVAPHGETLFELIEDLNRMQSGVYQMLDLTLDSPKLVPAKVQWPKVPADGD